MSEIELQLRNLLIEIFDTHMLNRLPADYGGQKFFSDPIFGISKGDDLIFYKFKEVVGTNHLTPLEIFNATGLTECAKNIRVISFIFPYSNIIREASKHVNKIPADEYCIGRNLDLGSKFLPIYNQYHAKDGKFVLTTLTEKQWHRLVSIVLKKTELAIDPRFDNPIKRFDQFDFLDELIEEWALGLTGNQAIKQLEEERIPCGKTYTMYETPSHPNLKARGMTSDDLDFSKWNVKKASIPGLLIKFSSCKGTIEKMGPEFGENNKEIYCELLGYSLDDLKRWKRKKII